MLSASAACRTVGACQNCTVIGCELPALLLNVTVIEPEFRVPWNVNGCV